MLKLIFLTTNKVKLAHARHMAESYPVVIESFRRKTFYASYIEPKIDYRDELLRQSYESALEQANNARVNTQKTCFFLEDTSVIVDALSKNGQEVPGVNAKYWMKDTKFADLDHVLTRAANRKVTVRSDFLLHIPEYYRQQWGIKDKYLIFIGKQNGTVVEAEQDVRTNLVFPWLDDKTFNKWFVPDGQTLPLSCLPIEIADRYDFRLRAFLEMMDFFAQRGLMGSPFEQQTLSFETSVQDSLPLLILCGFPCAGKTTLAQHFVREYGYVHIEASDFMYLNFYLRHDVGSGVNISDFAEEALRQKPQIAAEKIERYLNTLGEVPIVISGFRSMKEIEWLKGTLGNGEKRRSLQLAFVEASQTIRFSRFNKRKRDGQEIDMVQFQQQDDQQVRMGLHGISSSSEKVFLNEGTFEAFFDKARSELEISASTKIPTDIDLSVFHHFTGNIGLETPIFMALLSNWEEGENRPYFTTTEIAKLINELFPSMKPKHKDNVSRYFNQDYYAYYEIDPDPDENKRRYRLSNTGYGRAVSMYHDFIRQGFE